MTGSSTIVVDARNDTFSIGETQDISANLLSNDVVTGATASAVGLKVVSVNVPGVGNVAVGTAFTVTTASGRTGTARVNADGTFTFDGGDNFTSLVSGQTDSFTLHYTIQGTQAPVAGTVVMIEAEKMHLDNYRTELNLSSSGLYVIKGDDHEWNYASTTFAGATGRYNFDFKVLDEKDGASTIRVLINGVNVTGDIILNQGTTSDVWRTLSFANLEVKAGDRIEIQALAHSGEHARVDFLKFTATGQGGVPVTDTASVTVHINGEGQALGTLGGRVWLDSNGDNLEVNAAGGWESAVAGVTVQLLNTAGQVVATTLSNAGGEYAFNVAAGDYRVKFIAPGGFEFVTNDVGSNDGIDSDAGPGGVTVGTARVVAGQTTWEVDAGLRVPLAVDAVDDGFSVGEVQDISANILANDSPQNGSLSVVGLVANGTARTVGQSFTVTTEGGRTGTVTVNANGTFTFDGGNNFVGLNQGQTDRFELHYTAAATAQIEKKYNLLFVLDISNSTVGTGGVNAFNGAGVGDVNGDGIANTVLDAEIQGVLNVVAKLRAQGVNPANIDIGLVTFSGVAQGFATVNAATLGTFRLDAASLTAALTGIRSGGWTDYEAGLKEAEKWLGTQTGDGAENRVFFLSDGRPVINNVNGQDVLQTSANYGDEVARIAGNFGAQIHAIGIGANSDLAYLNELDNTGGAEKVLDVSTLAAALDRATPVLVTDQATVTVVVNGEGQANLLPQAVADMIQTDEDRAATPINVLANDNPGDGPVTVVAVQGGQVGQPITLTTTEDGQVLTATATLAADGTLTLVPGAAFDLLDAGEGRMFTLSYTLRDANGDLSSATISLVVNGLNEAPVAQDDAASGGERIAGLTGNVLANDSDPNGDALSVLDAGGLAPGSLISVVATSSAGRVLAGNVTILANGSYAFAPTAGVAAMSLGETVVFAVDYTARDPFGGTDTATLRVTITGANEGPVASANVYRTDEATAVVGNVLTDDTGAGVDSDPNGDAIAVTAVQGGTVGTAFAVTTAGGRQGSLLIEADGDLVFTPTAGFESLFDGQTDTVAVTYTISDANGATDTADVTVTIDGIDATPTAADDAVTIGETAPGSVALLANDTGGDGPLTVVSVAGGPATSGTATTEGGRTIAWSVDAQGVLTAALVDGADSLFVGETDRVTLDYGIADLDGDQDTAQVVVTIDGAGTPPDPTRLITVVGEVDTTGVPPQAIAVVLDMSSNAFTTQTTNLTGDVNGDGFASTAIDTQLRLLSNYANDLVADGRGGQELALVPTGFDAARPVAVVTADEIVAARVAGTLGAFFTAKIGGVDQTPVPGTTLFGDTIDIEAGLQAADAYFDAEGAGGGKVLVLTTTDGFSSVLSGLTPDPTDRVFASDPTAAAAALEARGGDIDVVYIRAGTNIDTAATTNPLRLIDSDDFVNRIVSSSLVALDSLVAEPVETVLGTLVDFSLSVNGELVAGIDADDVTANAAGFDFGPVVLEVDAGDALIEIGFGFDTDGDTLADEFKLITQNLAGDSFEFEVSLEDLLA